LRRVNGAVSEVTCAEFVPRDPAAVEGSVPAAIAVWHVRVRGSFSFLGPPGGRNCRAPEAIVSVEDATGGEFGASLLGSTCSSAERLIKGR